MSRITVQSRSSAEVSAAAALTAASASSASASAQEKAHNRFEAFLESYADPDSGTRSRARAASAAQDEGSDGKPHPSIDSSAKNSGIRDTGTAPVVRSDASSSSRSSQSQQPGDQTQPDQEQPGGAPAQAGGKIESAQDSAPVKAGDGGKKDADATDSPPEKQPASDARPESPPATQAAVPPVADPATDSGLTAILLPVASLAAGETGMNPSVDSEDLSQASDGAISQTGAPLAASMANGVSANVEPSGADPSAAPDQAVESLGYSVADGSDQAPVTKENGAPSSALPETAQFSEALAGASPHQALSSGQGPADNRHGTENLAAPQGAPERAGAVQQMETARISHSAEGASLRTEVELSLGDDGNVAVSIDQTSEGQRHVHVQADSRELLQRMSDDKGALLASLNQTVLAVTPNQSADSTGLTLSLMSSGGDQGSGGGRQTDRFQGDGAFPAASSDGDSSSDGETGSWATRRWRRGVVDLTV